MNKARQIIPVIKKTRRADQPDTVKHFASSSERILRQLSELYNCLEGRSGVPGRVLDKEGRSGEPDRVLDTERRSGVRSGVPDRVLDRGRLYDCLEG